MDWDAIGAIGEIVGAVAVVASLVYLATQIRTQIRESRLAASRELTANLIETYSALQTPQMADIWARGSKNYDALTESEKIQILAFFQRYFRALENAFHQASDGLLNQQVWDGIARHIGGVMSTEAAQRIWSVRKDNYSENFQEFIESIERTRLEIS